MKPRKEIGDASSSTVRKRKSDAVDLLKMEAGTTQEATTSMKALILMKGGQEERSKVLEEMGLGRELNEEESISMMADLNMTWYKYKNWARYAMMHRYIYNDPFPYQFSPFHLFIIFIISLFQMDEEIQH